MCGFVGMVADATDASVAAEIHTALMCIQHRGQDSAGIATMHAGGTAFHMRRGLGTAAQALGREDLEALVGPIGVGHVRYPTIGRGRLEDAQPFFYRQPGILMAHNGNVTNYAELSRSLAERSIHLLSQCDVEPALCELADALMARKRSRHTLEDAVAALRQMKDRVRGAYSIVAALMLDGQPTLVVVRDPNGIRPAVIGRRDDGAWLAASESVAFDVLGFSRVAAPGPGQAMFLRAGQEPVVVDLVEDAIGTPCVFEFIYFARPDAVMAEKSVYEIRLGLGDALAERIASKGIEADVVMAVPDTARPAATAMAEKLGLPLREGFIKNRYSGRTFIMPDALTRNAALRLKLNTLPGEIRGRRVLLVDDSIVRGTTLRRVIGMLRDASVGEVHLAIHSPPVTHPCFYGIDMSTEEELFATGLSGSLDELEVAAAAELGADSLSYLPVDAMDGVFGDARCAACFDGVYPAPIPDADRDAIAGDRRFSRDTPDRAPGSSTGPSGPLSG
jgi:amidophosphoribosyltransferase